MQFLFVLLLAVVGAIIGALINWAIYQWAMLQHRPISPWMKPRPDLVQLPEDVAKLKTLQPRSGLDYVPILGWFRLRRDGDIVGKWAWVRPLLIELTWMVGLPWFWLWQHGGGLLGADFAILIPAQKAQYLSCVPLWFVLHTLLIALMVIATFIDFDEQMIPDQITVPGTLIALLAALWPASRLPLPSAAPAGPAFDFVNFASPGTPVVPGWSTSLAALLTCLAIWLVWSWGLLPKIVPERRFRLGLIGNLKILLGSILRPARKTTCDIRTQTRKPLGITKLYVAIAIVGAVAIGVAWMFLLSDIQKLSLVSSFIGMGVAGGMIWGIRIVGGAVLGQQAMGFGDVTLMAMIGACIGWQASLAGFVYAMLFAVAFAIVLFVITRESYLAFGPYLCMGALAVLLSWPETWNQFRVPVFFLGPVLLVIGGVSLVMIAVLLPLVRWVKERALGVS